MCDIYTYIHEFFNSQGKYDYPYDKDYLIDLTDSNGVIIFFENGERYNELNRIVCVASHTSDDKLLDRLDQHYENNDQRSSTLRCQIGRAFLKIENNPYLRCWKIRDRNHQDVNRNYEVNYEKLVSTHLQDEIPFVVIPKVTQKSIRIEIRNMLISTLAQSDQRICSENWLGKHHDDERISGGEGSFLWNLNNTNGNIFTIEEFDELVVPYFDNLR